MRPWLRSLRLISLLIAGVLTIAGAPASAKIRVVDGDTIEVSGTVYRLHGIDAPEAGQACNAASGRTWPCGKTAIKAMQELVAQGDVICDDRGQDDYGRTLGVCMVNGHDINAAMVSAGLAWAFRKYSLDYAELEDALRSQRIGIWQAETITPWDFRAQKWAVAEQEAPLGCPIKGNISANGHIYHTPWSPWFHKTKVSEDQGERWFCSEAEALAAGWRAPYWGE